MKDIRDLYVLDRWEVNSDASAMNITVNGITIYIHFNRQTKSIFGIHERSYITITDYVWPPGAKNYFYNVSLIMPESENALSLHTRTLFGCPDTDSYATKLFVDADETFAIHYEYWKDCYE